MTTVRIALANLPFPDTAEDSVARAVAAVAEAGSRSVDVVCFPECYVPGYRAPEREVASIDADWLEHAWARVAEAAAQAGVAVVLGSERLDERGSRVATALVIDRDGTRLGFQDKVQIDPSEEGLYAPGHERRIFRVGALTFGIVICHEGWRYPETVRWAVRRGAQVVFHPQYHAASPGSYQPREYGDPANSFHEKAVLCRAAENICWFATANYAGAGSPTTSAIAAPDGSLLVWQPYGEAGLLVADLDLERATGLLARRYKPPACAGGE
jgi:predicted amidohydrolase